MQQLTLKNEELLEKSVPLSAHTLEKGSRILSQTDIFLQYSNAIFVCCLKCFESWGEDYKMEGGRIIHSLKIQLCRRFSCSNLSDFILLITYLGKSLFPIFLSGTSQPPLHLKSRFLKAMSWHIAVIATPPTWSTSPFPWPATL